MSVIPPLFNLFARTGGVCFAELVRGLTVLRMDREAPEVVERVSSVVVAKDAVSEVAIETVRETASDAGSDPSVDPSWSI